MKDLERADTASADDINSLHISSSNMATSEEDVVVTSLDESRDHVQMYSSLIAGLCSGTISATVCAPLDLVRTRMQVLGEVVKTRKNSAVNVKGHVVVQMFRDIIQKDGVAGCFRGLTATLLTVPAFWGAYCQYRTSRPTKNYLATSTTWCLPKSFFIRNLIWIILSSFIL
jgi:hypothetical protein